MFVRIVGGEPVAIHSIGLAGGASGMGVNRIGEVGDRASEAQAAGVYGTSFTAGSLTRKAAQGELIMLHFILNQLYHMRNFFSPYSFSKFLSYL